MSCDAGAHVRHCFMCLKIWNKIVKISALGGNELTKIYNIVITKKTTSQHWA